MWIGLLRICFFALVVRPLVLIVLGLNVRDPGRLPGNGPALVVANHNSHLDTLVLLSLFPLRMLPKLRPVAAMDYFMRNPALAWFSLNVIGIIPLDRDARSKGVDPLVEPRNALDRGDILILFPEGTRGEPELMADFKKGIAYLLESRPHVPTTPVFMHGLGRSLPRGAMLPVPLFLDVFVGEAIGWPGDRERYMRSLREAVQSLAAKFEAPSWD